MLEFKVIPMLLSRMPLVASILSLLALLGGCPLQQSAGNLPGGATTNNQTSNQTGGSGGQTAFESQLAESFPTCGVSPNEDSWREEILQLVNLERERVGLAPVVHNQTLENQATKYACEMIYYDFFDHVNPVTGSHLDERAQEFGYDFVAIGENLAAGQATPQQAMADWMDSPGHRANILNPNFTELGVGVRTGGEYHTYWVQEFGRPAGS